MNEIGTKSLSKYRLRKPKIGFVPVTMKLFWQLYPELEAKTMTRLNYIKTRLADYFDVVSSDLVGDRSEGDAAGMLLAANEVDLIVIWANGYVSSDIPVQVIDHLKEIPILLMITQKDMIIPECMDYPRYMENTALTPMMELGGALAKAGRPYTTVVGHDADDRVIARMQLYAEAAKVLHELRCLKIGSIGYPYPGMLDIDVDERAVNQIGPKITKISLPEFGSRFEAISDERAKEFVDATKHLYNTTHVKVADVIREARVYCTLEDIVDENGFDAFCIHDFECASSITKAISDFALSLLENQKGLCNGVEGDIPNTIGAFILSHLTGNASMFVDWTMFDQQQNALFFQHNGKADPDMVNEAILKPTAEPFGIIGDGAVFEVMGKPGPVTMLSMIHDGYKWKIFAGEGEALQADPSPCRLNQIIVKIDLPVQDYLEKLCNIGLTHHVNISHGLVLKEVRCLAEMMGVEFMTL